MEVFKCNMTADCANAVTHIDSSGFVYCAFHADCRRRRFPVRKIKPAEAKVMAAGGMISYRKK